MGYPTLPDDEKHSFTVIEHQNKMATYHLLYSNSDQTSKTHRWEYMIAAYSSLLLTLHFLLLLVAFPFALVLLSCSASCFFVVGFADLWLLLLNSQYINIIHRYNRTAYLGSGSGDDGPFLGSEPSEIEVLFLLLALRVFLSK